MQSSRRFHTTRCRSCRRLLQQPQHQPYHTPRKRTASSLQQQSVSVSIQCISFSDPKTQTYLEPPQPQILRQPQLQPQSHKLEISSFFNPTRQTIRFSADSTTTCRISKHKHNFTPAALSSSRSILPLVGARTFSSSSSTFDNDTSPRRCQVRAVGENWTGAFGDGPLDTVVPGHQDEDEDQHVQVPRTVFEGPLRSMEDLPSVGAGWGHSALRAGDNVYLAGQAHDWSKLLRYRRLPPSLAKWATKFERHEATTFGQSLSWLMDKYNGNTQLNKSLLPTVVRKFNAPGLPMIIDETRDRWREAETFSFVHAWKAVPLPETEIPVQIKCSAALTAVRTQSGRLYSFGQNHWGQCGTGMITASNVWLPEHPVVRSVDDDVSDDFLLRLSSGMEPNGETGTTTNGINGTFPSSLSSSSLLLRPPAENFYLHELLEDDPERHHIVEENGPFDVLAVRDFDLGLQHGVAVDPIGRLYTWGKGKRGQLGQARIWDDSSAALRVSRYFSLSQLFEMDATSSSSQKNTRRRPVYQPMEPITQVAAGHLHCAAFSALTSNVYIWGKNTLPPLPTDKARGKKSSDAKLPYQLPRESLPDMNILQIACGSHHTAMLMEDGSVYAVGISTDTQLPLVQPVCLVPPGVVELPVRFFGAHMDRTTVIGASGQQVLQAHLWADPELQAYAMFTPAWADLFLDAHPQGRVEQVHRSWVHSLIVTTTPDDGPDSDDPVSRENETNTTSNETDKDKQQIQ